MALEPNFSHYSNQLLNDLNVTGHRYLCPLNYRLTRYDINRFIFIWVT